MKIAYISSEISPIAKVGGLSDVTLGLSRAIQSLGNETFVILPKHKSLKTKYLDFIEPTNTSFSVPFGKKKYQIDVFKGKLHGINLFFLDPTVSKDFFDREQIYGYRDDPSRYAFFSLAALEFISQNHPDTELIHINEWHTALVAPLYKVHYQNRFFSKVVLTIHNLNYQGVTGASLLGKVGLDSEDVRAELLDPKKPGKINMLKGGIHYADFVTTVSPKYYQEIQTPSFGKGLEETILKSNDKMTGILNGIDYEIWNPATDTSLETNYSIEHLDQKIRAKNSVQKILNMPVDEKKPLITCVCRLVPQKGIHMIKQAISYSAKQGAQFILFGSSPIDKIQKDFEAFSKTFANNPNIKFVFNSYNEELSHKIYAGADMIICPSLFEPCGLTQLIALQYGTVPIVRETGGLADTVFDLEKTKHANGFTYTSPTRSGIEGALKRAIKTYLENPHKWQEIIRAGMEMDFSWSASAKKYSEIYTKVLQDKPSVQIS